MNHPFATALVPLIFGIFSQTATAATGLLWRNTTSGANYQFVLDHNQLIAEHDSLSLAAPWQPIVSGDFNGDGDDDLFWRNPITGENQIQLFNNGKPTGFSPYNAIADTSWSIVGAGDLDGDKTTDLIWQHKTSNEIYSQLLHNNQISTETRLFKLPDNAWQLAAVQDFDADGKADLLFRHKLKGYLYLMNMDASQIKREYDLFTVSDLDWQIASVQDINGDNKADILWRNQKTGENYLFYMNNQQVLQDNYLPKVADLNWQLLQITDLTDDHQAELIWNHRTTNEVVIHSVQGFQLLNERSLMQPPAGWQLRFFPKIQAQAVTTFTELRLNLLAASINLSQSLALTGTGTFADGRSQTLDGATLVWSSSNSAVAAVTNGLITSLTAGNSQICATSGPLKQCADIQIKPLSKINLAVNKPSNWAANVYLYTWANGVEFYGKWPGTKINLNNGVYGTAIPAENFSLSGCLKLIFNDGAGNKTADLKRCTNEGDAVYNTGRWQNLTPQPIELVVNNSLGSGFYPIGSQISLAADAAPKGLSFTRWLGSASSYANNTTQASIKLNLPATANKLSLRAQYDDAMANNRAAYQQNCMACHGLNGEGTAAAMPLTLNIQQRYTLESLTHKIASTMPPLAIQLVPCDANCAAATAAYIWAGLPQQPANYCELKGSQPEPRQLRLLTSQEYRNSVKSLFGLSDTQAQALSLPADQVLKTGYNNDVSRHVISADNYLDAALQVAATTSLATLAPACVNDLNCQIKTLGRKVFRRPLSSEELSRYTRVATASETTMLASWLISPYFLFRSELGEHELSNGYQLSDWEIATLLSYSLWGTTPDDLLLDLAEQAQLHSPEQIKTQVQRLLIAPQARSQYQNFIASWLPNYIAAQEGISPSLANALSAETPALVTDLAFNHAKVADLFTSNYSLMNAELAQYYGINSVSGSQLQKVSYGAGDTNQRQGILSHAGFLIAHASETSPILRGVFVRRQLLCQDLPSPVIRVNPVPETGLPLRERLESHTQNAGCGGCHQYINGIGLGFERFDSMGKYHELYAGQPIDQSGRILDLNTTTLNPDINAAAHTSLSFNNGVKELSQLLSQSQQPAFCYARQYYRYQAGHHEQGADECQIQSLHQSSHSLLELLIQYSQSANFSIRQ